MTWGELESFKVAVSASSSDDDSYIETIGRMISAFSTYTEQDIVTVFSDVLPLAEQHVEDKTYLRQVAKVLGQIFTQCEGLQITVTAVREAIPLVSILAKCIPSAEFAVVFMASLIRCCPVLSDGCVKDGELIAEAGQVLVDLCSAYIDGGASAAYFVASSRLALIYSFDKATIALAAGNQLLGGQETLRKFSVAIARFSFGETHPLSLFRFFQAALRIFPLVEMGTIDDPVLVPQPQTISMLRPPEDVPLGDLLFESYAAFFPLEYVPDRSGSVTQAEMQEAFDSLWIMPCPFTQSMEVEYLVDVVESAYDEQERLSAYKLLARIVQHNHEGLGVLSPYLSTIWWALSQDAVHVKDASITDACADIVEQLLQPSDVPSAKEAQQKLVGLVSDYVARDIEFDLSDPIMSTAAVTLAVATMRSSAETAYVVFRRLVPSLIGAVVKTATVPPGQSVSVDSRDMSVAASRLGHITSLMRLLESRESLQSAGTVELTGAFIQAMNAVLAAQKEFSPAWTSSEEAYRVIHCFELWLRRIVYPLSSPPGSQQLLDSMTVCQNEDVEASRLLTSVIGELISDSRVALAGKRALALLICFSPRCLTAASAAYSGDENEDPGFYAARAAVSPADACCYASRILERDGDPQLPVLPLSVLSLVYQDDAALVDTAVCVFIRCISEWSTIGVAGLRDIASQLQYLLLRGGISADQYNNLVALPFWLLCEVAMCLPESRFSHEMLGDTDLISRIPSSSQCPETSWPAVVRAVVLYTQSTNSMGASTDLGQIARVSILARDTNIQGDLLKKAAYDLVDAVLPTGLGEQEASQRIRILSALDTSTLCTERGAVLITSLLEAITGKISEFTVTAASAAAMVVSLPRAIDIVSQSTLQRVIPALVRCFKSKTDRYLPPAVSCQALTLLAGQRPDALTKWFCDLVSAILNIMNRLNWEDNELEINQNPQAFSVPILNLLRALAVRTFEKCEEISVRKISQILSLVLRSPSRSVRNAARGARCSWLLL